MSARLHFVLVTLRLCAWLTSLLSLLLLLWLMFCIIVALATILDIATATDACCSTRLSVLRMSCIHYYIYIHKSINWIRIVKLECARIGKRQTKRSMATSHLHWAIWLLFIFFCFSVRSASLSVSPCHTQHLVEKAKDQCVRIACVYLYIFIQMEINIHICNTHKFVYLVTSKWTIERLSYSHIMYSRGIHIYT